MEKRIPILPFALLPLWVIVYMALQPGVDYLVDRVLSLSGGTALTEALRYKEHACQEQ